MMRDRRFWRRSGRRPGPAEVVAALAAPSRDRAERWHRIQDFIAGWDRPLTEVDGCSADEIEATEERLGRPLPLALAEMYRLLGHRTEVASGQDVLLPIGRMDISGSLARFAVENQAIWYWGVRLDEMDAEDPPVVVDNGLVSDDEIDWSVPQEFVFPIGLTVSEYALTAVLIETGIFRRRGHYASERRPMDPVSVGFRAVPLPSFLLRGYDARSGIKHPASLFVHELGVAYQDAELWVGPRRLEARAELAQLIPPEPLWDNLLRQGL